MREWFWVLVWLVVLSKGLAVEDNPEDSPLIEYPSIYIYPYYWIYDLPVQSTPVQGSEEDQDVCTELNRVVVPVMAL